MLYVPTPWLFTYHTVDALRGSPQMRVNVWAVAKSEFAVFAFFTFFDSVY